MGRPHAGTLREMLPHRQQAVVLFTLAELSTAVLFNVASPGRRLRAVQLKRAADATKQQSSPSTIVPNDLWAIHDLVEAGYGAIMMTPGSAGEREVQKAALELVELLPQLHLYEPCRVSIREALLTAGTGERARVVAAARASWTCLPGKFDHTSFNKCYDMEDAEMLASTNVSATSFALAKRANMPGLTDESVLGACKGSAWPRTCSYWVSMHTMAYRADALGLAKPFLRAVVPLLSGGNTFCWGCTKHFRVLTEPVLTPAVRDDMTRSL